jgi:hypothetical protein
VMRARARQHIDDARAEIVARHPGGLYVGYPDVWRNARRDR